MKFILTILLLINTVYANKNLDSIYENILLKNTEHTQKVAKNLAMEIQNANLTTAHSTFTELVKAWKSVEAFYILGDLDDNYLDTPRYIDTFHQGNEDIKVQLDLILESNEDLSFALYKNSHKTINALEYILC